MKQSRYSSLRWALVLAAISVASLGATAAQAGTGGASSFATTPSAASTSVGADVAFSAWRSAGASWYGPGLYGNGVACGGTLRPSTIGVAHKTLPCGTPVKFKHRGHVVIARVIDRGPYISGRAWDLTEAAAEALDFEDVGVGRVQYAVATSYARGK
ncbi:MAG TPA: septal ring lytic transglycosylase RlpA family protein [Solirubrobacterales bacterium]|jgi:rare lipoprotein A (peptidoglycan hydrolase)|nr:septal ring lytic transglycosylase RlpA family protein [Solirubrobacterales bacterium]